MLKKLILLLTLLLLPVVNVYSADTAAVSVPITTATKVVSQSTSRREVILRVDTAATACVTCGPGLTDAAFPMCAGDVLIVTVIPSAEIYCVSTSGTQTVYYWVKG
jgi:hypothetical protein